MITGEAWLPTLESDPEGEMDESIAIAESDPEVRRLPSMTRFLIIVLECQGITRLPSHQS